jgi:aryl-alcohol dehydrogenase-like predicted oxidoreductase
MLTRPIPSTGEPMPVIGLGTWRTFYVGADEATRRRLREVWALLDAGGRIIDSSPMYGRAEAVTGDLLAELAARPRAFLATKVWTIGDRPISTPLSCRSAASSSPALRSPPGVQPEIDILGVQSSVYSSMYRLMRGENSGPPTAAATLAEGIAALSLRSRAG